MVFKTLKSGCKTKLTVTIHAVHKDLSTVTTKSTAANSVMYVTISSNGTTCESHKRIIHIETPGSCRGLM